MRYLTKATLILTTLFSTMATAANSDVIFSCASTNGEPIMVKKVGDDYQYSQGSLSFKNTIKEVLNNNRSEISAGSGFTTVSLELTHQGSSYVVGFIQPRGSKKLDNPSVDIYTKNGTEYVQTIECNTSKPITQHFEIQKMRHSGL